MFFYKESEVVPPPSFDFTVSSTAELITAIGAATAGDSIFVSAGNYTLTSSLSISKSLRLFGAGSGSTIFQTAGTSADPVTMVTVSSDNVVFKDITFKHRKTSNTSVETAISISAGGFPTFTYPKNFIMDGCRVEYLEFGVVIRGEGFKLANNRFVYATGTAGNSNRCIGIYGQKGNCFIANNIFDNSVLSSTTFRPIYSTSTNATSNELTTGALIVSGNTNVGAAVQQFYNQDNLRGTTGGYDLYFLNNTINETSLFVGLWNGAANVGNIIGKIVLDGNTASGIHGGAPLGTKGMLNIDNSGAFRSTNLPVYVGTNNQTNQTFRTGYVAITQNPASTVPAYLLGRASAVTVTADVSTAIPTAPTMPATPSS
jgi:hypothetical protein